MKSIVLSTIPYKRKSDGTQTTLTFVTFYNPTDNTVRCSYIYGYNFPNGAVLDVTTDFSGNIISLTPIGQSELVSLLSEELK